MYTTAQEQEFALLAKNILAQKESLFVEETIATLKKIIRYNDWKYYVQDNPILADVEYDQLFALLKSLEKAHPSLVTADSPTQRLASGISNQFSTESHMVPMLSLENSYNAEDLIAWDKRCRETIGLDNIVYSVEPKYDGAGISLLYENNILQRGLTRGDGLKGENITANIRQIKSIPLQADFDVKNIQSVEIRGEVLIPKKTFAAFNEQRIADGLAPLANPRNAASGTLRMLDPKEVAKRGLNAVLYHVSYTHFEDETQGLQALQSHYDTLQMLYSLGFVTPFADMKKCDNITEVIAFCKLYEQKRDELPFEIDGMVIKVNSSQLQDSLGMTTHHPRWAMAYKFKARQASSKLLNVEFQVGRTGAVTPVAKIEPVNIGGVMVSSISLFNEDVVREKDLRIGDTVLVERAGDVIPYIVKSMPEIRNGSEQAIVFPHSCPVCQEPLLKPEGEAAWRCINANCAAQVVEHIIHFASKDAMDIRNLGDANIRRFYELGLLKNITDIYALDFEKIKTLDKFGEKSVINLKQAIEASKSQALHRLIFGLGIRFVGETTAKTLANAVTNIHDFKSWSIEQLCTLEDIGPKVASSVFHFFHSEENLHLLDTLEHLGLNVINQSSISITEGSFSGKTFLFTGTLTHFKRSEAEAKVEALGGQILSGVSSKLNYLIVGTDAGSKLEKAKKLGNVTILDELEFLKLLES